MKIKKLNVKQFEEIHYNIIKKSSSRELETFVYQSVIKFINWLTANGYTSYDQYDFWSTAFGIRAKKIYYKNRFLGTPFVAPVFFAEIFFPGIRKIFVSKKRFPIADAHFILAFLNLYEYSSEKKYLDEAEKISTEMLKSSIKGYSGYCWGYPFDWMTTRGLWTKGIPLITTTAYCFEAFLKLYDITLDEKYLNIAHSIFLFTLNDLRDTKIEENVSSASYSPIDSSQIVNANAYRSFVLVEGFTRFKNNNALKKAQQNINFILKFQNSNGSWQYAVNDERDNFVDNFHTCFVLKNLYKANLILKDEKISEAIKKGFDFYKENLIDSNNNPKPFAKLSRLNTVVRELYDFAEGISLCLLLQNDPDAKRLAHNMVNEVIHSYQKNNGSFVTRISILNMPNHIPYVRWPQAQLFFALTNYLKN